MGNGFFRGSGFLGRGLRLFFRDRRLWKFAALPLLPILLGYAAAVWGAVVFAVPRCERFFDQWIAFPGWLAWLGTGLLWFWRVGFFLALALLLVVAFSSLYEIFGGVLFDLLAEAVEKNHLPGSPPPVPLLRQLRMVPGSLLRGAFSGVLLLLCAVLSLFFPIVGQAAAFVFLGGRWGVSAMMSAGCIHGLSVAELKRAARCDRAAVFGFGVASYALLLIPVVSFVFLPGIVVGGTLLFHELRARRPPEA